MKKLFVFAALFVVAASIVGCRAEGEIRDASSIALPR